LARDVSSNRSRSVTGEMLDVALSPIRPASF
jgi:hypothetical protein